MDLHSELTFSAKQAAARLGLSPAMTRRYAAALEELTGKPVRQHPRDGRQYTGEQLETMIRAKGFVDANARLSVTEALELASGKAAVATSILTQELETPLGAQNEALVHELRTLVTLLKAGRDDEMVVDELRALRAEVAALREDVKNDAAQLSPAKLESSTEVNEKKLGAFARIGERFDTLIKRLRG